MGHKVWMTRYGSQGMGHKVWSQGMGHKVSYVTRYGSRHSTKRGRAFLHKNHPTTTTSTLTNREPPHSGPPVTSDALAVAFDDVGHVHGLRQLTGPHDQGVVHY